MVPHTSTTCVSHIPGYINRPYTHRRHAHEQIDIFLFVIREAVGVESLADGRVFGFLFFVLVENPFECGVVPSLYSQAACLNASGVTDLRWVFGNHGRSFSWLKYC
jgi:hypothetical protein